MSSSEDEYQQQNPNDSQSMQQTTEHISQIYDKWNSKSKVIQQDIYQFEKCYGNILKFCQTTTMKNDVMRLKQNRETMIYDREIEKDSLFKSIKDIKTDIFNIQELLNEYDTNEESFVIEKLKKDGTSIENKINKLKKTEGQYFTWLGDKSEQLETDIYDLAKKLEVEKEDWTAPCLNSYIQADDYITTNTLDQNYRMTQSLHDPKYNNQSESKLYQKPCPSKKTLVKFPKHLEKTMPS